MKNLALLVVLVFGTLFFQFRYLAPEAGVNTVSPDYSNHISIEQHLKEGHFFPDLDKVKLGVHAVSRYLPVYHGLLGFHISALVLEVFGVPLPGAYQLLMDICLLIYVIFFAGLLANEWKREKRWEYLLVVFCVGSFFISNFASGVEAAFFSQIMSYALALVAWYLWKRRRYKISVMILLVAIVTYPDLLVWTLPVLILGRKFRIPLIFRILLSVVWACIIYVLFSRRNLVGPEALSLYPVIFLPLIAALFWRQLYREQRLFLYLLVSYSTVVIGMLITTQRNFTFSYYAIKLTYPAVFFLIYAFTKIRILSTVRGRVLVFIFAVFFWGYSDLNPKAMIGYFQRSQIVNNKLYESMQTTRRLIDELSPKCFPENTLVLPDLDDVSGKSGMSRLWAKNSMLRNSDMSSEELKAQPFKRMYDSFSSFEHVFSGPLGIEQGTRSFFSLLARVEPRTQDVCIVSPASSRSMFNGNTCFEILKEEGGQIYARCKATAEF
jgi:hypothetical protein